MTILLGGVGWEGWGGQGLSCLRGWGNGRVLAPEPEPRAAQARGGGGWTGACGSALEGGVYGGVRGRHRIALAAGTGTHIKSLLYYFLSLPGRTFELKPKEARRQSGVSVSPSPLAFLCPSDAGIAPTRPRLLLCWAPDPAPHPPLSPTPLPLPPGSLPFERPGSQTCSRPSALPVTLASSSGRSAAQRLFGGFATPPHPPGIATVLRDLDSSGSLRGLCEC